MATVKGANVTKYDAGGSGDNYIPDGYIKSVEKVWLDSYTFTSAIPSGTVIHIAKVPPNKKITGIKLFFPSLSTGAAATGSTISLGTLADDNLYLDAGEASTGVLTLEANLQAGIQDVTSSTTETTITLTVGRIATTTTAGTIKTIVKYT